jgi:cytochrome c oxidase subunit IV
VSSHHVVPIKVYAAVFAALLILTLTTTGVAFVDLGGNWNVIAALTIACGKALLVIFYFMHLRYADRQTWVLAGAGVFWLAILITLTLGDVLTRNQSATEAGWATIAATRSASNP